MTETTQAPKQVPIRVGLVRVAGVTLVGTAMSVLVVLTGVGPVRGGWLWVPAIATMLASGVGWWRWHVRGRLFSSVALSLSRIALDRGDLQAAVLSHARLRAAMDSIPVPSTFEQTGDFSGGWSRCLDECTSYTRHWLAPGEVGEVRARLRGVLEGEGFVLREWSTTRRGFETATTDGHRDGLRVIVGVDTRWAWKDGALLTLAPGQVGITAILEPYSAPE